MKTMKHLQYYRRAALMFGAHAVVTFLVPIVALVIGLAQQKWRGEIMAAQSLVPLSALYPEYDLIHWVFYPIAIGLFVAGSIQLMMALGAEYGTTLTGRLSGRSADR